MRFALPLLAPAPAPAPALAIALALALSGCASAAAGSRSDIRGIEWHAIDVNGVPVGGEPRPTLRLAGANRATGSGGCNSFGTTYRLRSRMRLELGPIASTRMACPGPIGEQEARYLSILEAAETYSRYGDGSLSVIAPDGRAVRFRKR